MSRDNKYALWGPILLVLILVVAKYLLEWHNNASIAADPCMLKSPNECKAMNGQTSP
jgi:hypothetical protein